MNISNDTGGMDSSKLLDYVTNQFPGDLAAMISARDELAVRQGALSAAEDTVKLKAQAAFALESATDEAAALRAEAKVYVQEAKAQKAAADTREKELNARDDKMVEMFAAREKALIVKETQVQSQMNALDAKDARLFADQAQLESDRVALDARVKAFQDKVASING